MKEALLRAVWYFDVCGCDLGMAWKLEPSTCFLFFPFFKLELNFLRPDMWLLSNRGSDNQLKNFCLEGFLAVFTVS